MDNFLLRALKLFMAENHLVLLIFGASMLRRPYPATRFPQDYLSTGFSLYHQYSSFFKRVLIFKSKIHRETPPNGRYILYKVSLLTFL